MFHRGLDFTGAVTMTGLHITREFHARCVKISREVTNAKKHFFDLRDFQQKFRLALSLLKIFSNTN
jgi:hypothetical protein